MALDPAHRKRIIPFLLFITIGFGVLYLVDPYEAESPEPGKLYYFYRPECPACAGMKAYLNKIRPDYPYTEFLEYDVMDMVGRATYTRYMKWFNKDYDVLAVPVVITDKGVVQGFRGEEVTGPAVLALLKKDNP